MTSDPLTPTTSATLAKRAVIVARIASALVAAAALAILVGWLRNLPELTSLYLAGPTVKPNAALSILCGALANVMLISSGGRRSWRIAGCLTAAVPVVIGGLTLYQHLTSRDLGIDQLIATEQVGALATMSPNRMGPPASIANLLIGLALFLGSGTSPRLRTLGQSLSILTFGIALLPLMGYAYGFSELYAIPRYTGIALINAIALVTLALAVQAGRPEVGLASLVCRADEVGVFARRMLPASVLLPFGIGWVFARTYSAGSVNVPFAISMMALVFILLMAGVIWRTGTQLVLSLDARAATERALADRERILREADQQKTEFLATLSHELRNPLAPIRFAVELLNGPASSAAAARKTIERQVQHLTRLIDDLLDLTRISRNKLELHIRPSDLRQLVHDALDAVSNEVRRARHELDLDLPVQPVWLNVDPDRVVQMLVNLLTNAIKYSDPGGTIRIGTEIENADATIYVRDTGHGISAVDLDRIFDRFVQVGKTQHGGLGIGLALVKALAELHGGHVRVRSAGRGKGSEFRIRLPRAAGPPDVTVGEEMQVRACRILVVDDNRDAADMLRGLLTDGGHTVQVAYDGETALRQAAAFVPDVGLLDIGMSGMDGYQLAARLRKDPRLRDLFLVAITGYGQEEDRRRALSVGFDAHLTKPADPTEIARLLAARFPGAEPSRELPMRGASQE